MGGSGDDANRAPAVYGLGMQVDIAKRTFKVLRVSQLEDASGKSLNHNVNVGDELVAADGTVQSRPTSVAVAARLKFVDGHAGAMVATIDVCARIALTGRSRVRRVALTRSGHNR